MKKTMMYLPEEMHRYLAREATARGISMAEVAREAIAEYRTRRTQDREEGVSAIFGVLADSEQATDLSTQVDETLSEYFGAGGIWERDNSARTD